MKKTLCLIVTVSLFLMCTVPALATSISATLYCDSTTHYTNLGNWASGSHSGKVYVYHTVNTSVPNYYNNHFRIYVNNATSPNASKWCTPNSNIPIESSAITTNCTVTLEGRGNTYYHDDGFSSISVGGSFGWPL